MFAFTGDVGYPDLEGFVHITDRKKDMIVSGGFNVYSSEVMKREVRDKYWQGKVRQVN